MLAIVFALFALIVVNSVYLVSVTVQGEERQGWFYLWMFLLHLILGLLIVVPTIVFGLVHLRNTYNRPNRQAVRAGWATFLAAILTFISGIALTRVDLGSFRLDLTNDAWRSAAYWAHVAAPLMASWMFVLHRLAGRRIKWKIGAKWAGVAAGFAALMFMVQTQDPRSWGREGPESADYFEPSLARTTSGDFIDAEVLDNDEYCLQCHEDAYQSWSHSAHRFSSFNNGPYAKSLQDTRALPLRLEMATPKPVVLCRLSRPRSVSLRGHLTIHDGMIRITRFRRIPLAKPPSLARFATPSAM